nr:MAG TPA: hypothetical protein [Bacteriophage sp.]
MEFENNISKVYIKIDSQNRIIQCDGGYTEANVIGEGWIQIDEGYGDKYNLCQTHYFEDSLYTSDGFYRYKYINNEIVERTADELAADKTSLESIVPEATQLDRIEAQVMYTALMTDSLIEGDA